MIDAAYTGATVMRENAEQTDAMVSGFTLTGGVGWSWGDLPDGNSVSGGGGIAIYQSRLIVDNCIVMENYSQGWAGGGALCLFADLTILNSIVRDNVGGYGGGINVYHGTLTCENVHIHSNVASYHYWAGGGIDIWSRGYDLNERVVLRDVVIEDNTSSADFPGCEGLYNGGELIVSNTVTDSVLNAGWIGFDPESEPSDLVINGDYAFVHGSQWFGAEGGRIQLYVHEQDGNLVPDQIWCNGQFGVQHQFDESGSVGLLDIQFLSEGIPLKEQLEFLTFSQMDHGFSAIATSGLDSTQSLEMTVGASSDGNLSALLATVVEAIQIGGEVGGVTDLPEDVQSLISGDFNGDGYPDVCLAMPASIPGWQGQLLFLLNGGTNASDEWNGFSGKSLLVGLPSLPSGLTSGYLQTDGRLDVVVSLPYAPGVAVAINRTISSGQLEFEVYLVDGATLGDSLASPIGVALLPDGEESAGNLVVINEEPPSVSVLDLRPFGDLDCVCDALFSAGERVVAAVDSPGGADGVSAGALGTVRCGFQIGGGELYEYLYVSWDNWNGGVDNGSEYCNSGCGDGSSSGTNSHAFVQCTELEFPAPTSVTASQATLGNPSDVRIREADPAIIVTQSDHQNLLVFTDGGASPLDSLEEIDLLFGQGAVAIGDLDGNSVSDLVISVPLLETVAIALGEPDGTYLPWLGVPIDGQPGRIELGDMDADGDQDIAVLVTLGNGQSSIQMYRNDQSDKQAMVLSAIGSVDLGGSQPRSFVLTDLDVDGTDDFVIVTEIEGLQRGGAGTSLKSVLMRGNDHACPGDADGNGVVNIDDLLSVIGEFNNDCEAGAPCTSDFDDNGVVNIDDLLIVIGAFGPCP